MYQVNLDQFSGPLEKLLELIEARKLDVTRVHLAEVTADFIAYTERIEREAPPGIVADFLVVAARLLLIKSKALLPDLAVSEEEEDEIVDLETRLAIYREFRRGGKRIAEQWGETPQMASRPLLAALGEGSVFYPPPGVGTGELADAVRRLLASLEAFIREPDKVRNALVSVEAKIRDILARFEGAAAHSFRALSSGKPRSEVVALFLAVLQLFRDRRIHIEQEGQFGDIMVKQSNDGN